MSFDPVFRLDAARAIFRCCVKRLVRQIRPLVPFGIAQEDHPSRHCDRAFGQGRSRPSDIEPPRQPPAASSVAGTGSGRSSSDQGTVTANRARAKRPRLPVERDLFPADDVLTGASSISSIVIGAAARIRAEAAPPVISATARIRFGRQPIMGLDRPATAVGHEEFAAFAARFGEAFGKASVSSAPERQGSGARSVDLAVPAQSRPCAACPRPVSTVAAEPLDPLRQVVNASEARSTSTAARSAASRSRPLRRRSAPCARGVAAKAVRADCGPYR